MVARVKICSACKSEKPLSAYYKKMSTKDGMHHQCRTCHNKQNAKANKKRHQVRRAKLLTLLGNKCKHCLQMFPHVAMDLHHLNPKGKDFSFNNLQGRAWSRVITEAKKCILLCANCHRIEHERMRKRK